MKKIRYQNSSTYRHIPENHEYRDETGRPSLDYLIQIEKRNKSNSEMFRVALNNLSHAAPFKDYIVSWKIEEYESE